MLRWDAEHTDNLIHMSRTGAWTDRNQKRLNAQDDIPPSDDEESDKDSDGVRTTVPYQRLFSQHHLRKRLLGRSRR